MVRVVTGNLWERMVYAIDLLRHQKRFKGDIDCPVEDTAIQALEDALKAIEEYREAQVMMTVYEGKARAAEAYMRRQSRGRFWWPW